MNYRSSRFW